MVNVRFFSDLHCEFMEDRGRGFIESLDPTGADVLVIAGDLTNPALLGWTLEMFLKQFPEADIVFVLGNHDYYGMSLEGALFEAKSISLSNPRLHVLEREAVEIRGQRFFGATLWYPISYALDPIVFARWQSWSDYRWIEQSARDIPGVYEKTLKDMEQQLEPGDIVVTHMLPSPASIAPQWRGVKTNAFFLGDCTGIIAAKRPKLWIHGHTHCHMDYYLGQTQVVANPRGLPWLGDDDEGENPKFDPNWGISI